MSEQPTHAMLVRADDGLHLLPACTARKCAERTVTFVTGADVLGIVELYPEPIPGVQFWSAVQLGNAPKTAAEPSSQWRPIAEAPRDGNPFFAADQHFDIGIAAWNVPNPYWGRPPRYDWVNGGGSAPVYYLPTPSAIEPQP